MLGSKLWWSTGLSEGDGRDEEWAESNAVEVRQTQRFDGQEDEDVQRCRDAEGGKRRS